MDQTDSLFSSEKLHWWCTASEAECFAKKTHPETFDRPDDSARKPSLAVDQVPKAERFDSVRPAPALRRGPVPGRGSETGRRAGGAAASNP